LANNYNRSLIIFISCWYCWNCLYYDESNSIDYFLPPTLIVGEKIDKNKNYFKNMSLLDGYRKEELKYIIIVVFEVHEGHVS